MLRYGAIRMLCRPFQLVHPLMSHGRAHVYKPNAIAEEASPILTKLRSQRH